MLTKNAQKMVELSRQLVSAQSTVDRIERQIEELTGTPRAPRAQVRRTRTAPLSMARFVELISNGMRPREIATRYGKSVQSMYAKASEARTKGLLPRPGVANGAHTEIVTPLPVQEAASASNGTDPAVGEPAL